MRRSLVWVLAAGTAAGCLGYERPNDRRLDAIGAPATDVGSSGLNLSQDEIFYEESAGGDVAGEPARADARPRQKFTEVGQVSSRSPRSITLKRPTGDVVQLKVQPLTNITMDGRPVSPGSLPAGAEVRASYVVDGQDRVAERIEVIRREDAEGRGQGRGRR